MSGSRNTSQVNLRRVLESRYFCLVAGCSCGSWTIFVGGVPESNAYKPSENCHCGHSWISHLAFVAQFHGPNQIYAQGPLPSNNCGGFYSVVTSWDPDTKCACGRFWYEHLNKTAINLVRDEYRALQQGSSQGTRSNVASSSPLAIPPPPPPSALAASPPILAYSSSLSAHSTNTPSSSTASSSSGNTNTRRVASFTAHNQQSSGAGRPTRRAHASNPNPNAQKARATTDHNSFKATTSEGHIMLGLWPYMPPDRHLHVQYDDTSPKLKWEDHELRTVQRAMRTHDLIIDVMYPTDHQGPIWELFDSAILSHCDVHDISLEPTPEGEPREPFTLSWTVLQPGRKGGKSHDRQFNAPDDLTPTNFNLDKMKKSPYGHNLPNYLDSDDPFLFIAPRYANIKKSISTLLPAVEEEIDNRRLPHKCFATRFCSPLGVVELNRDPICFPRCAFPRQEDLENPKPTDVINPYSTPNQMSAASSSSVVSHGGNAFVSPVLPSQNLVNSTTPASSSHLNVGMQPAGSSNERLPPPRPPLLTTSPEGTPQPTQPLVRPRSSSTENENTEGRPQVRRRLDNYLDDEEYGRIQYNNWLTEQEEQRLILTELSADPTSTPAAAAGTGSSSIASESLARRTSPAVHALPLQQHFTSPSTLFEIRGWTSHAVRGLVHQSPTSSIFYLHAPDVNAGARALLCVLLWHCQKILGFDTGGSLEEVLKADEPGVDCSTELPLEYLFHDVTNYSCQNGFGSSPAHAIINKAVELATQGSTLWLTSLDQTDPNVKESYKRIHWHGSYSHPNQLRTARLMSHGVLALLHIIQVEAAPEPISPHLLLYALDGPDSFLMDPAFLKYIDIETYKRVEPWIEWTKLGSISAVSKLGVLLGAADISAETLTEDREELYGVERTLLTTVCLGIQAPTAHCDFISFKEGVRWVLDQGKMVANEIHTSSKPLLAALYSRQVRAVSDVTTHIVLNEQSTSGDDRQLAVVIDEDDDDLQEYYAIRFKELLIRYLHGTGHPQSRMVREAQQLLNCSATAEEQSDPLLRCRLLLRVMTGLSTLPIGTSWRLQFNYDYVPLAEDADQVQEAKKETHAIRYQACHKTGGVRMDESLRNLLIEPEPKDPSIPTCFDEWFHIGLLQPEAFDVA